MKKSILFIVAFMLLGLSFAKAQQIQNGVYLIINEKTKKALTDESGKVTQTTVRNGQANQEWRISDYNDGAKIVSPANNNANDKDGNFRTLVKFDVSTQSSKLRVSYTKNSPSGLSVPLRPIKLQASRLSNYKYKNVYDNNLI